MPSKKTIYSKVRKPGHGHQFREHTVAELISMLKAFPPNARVLLFDLNTPSHYYAPVALSAASLPPESRRPKSSGSNETPHIPLQGSKRGPINAVFISALVGRNGGAEVDRAATAGTEEGADVVDLTT